MSRVTTRAIVCTALSVASLACVAPRQVLGQQVHVLIVTGLAGEPQYKKAFIDEAAMLADTARKRWGVPDSSLISLGEDPAADPRHVSGVSTREEVAKAFLRLSTRVAPGDVLLRA